MIYHTNRRFLDHVPAITALADKNPAFSAIIADYEEMCTWLATLNRDTPPDDGEIENARELIRDLEEEILSHLKEHEGNTGRKYDRRNK